jgi:hypothetical protein
MTCSIDGCTKKVFARGWCSAHWRRWRHHGHPLGGSTGKGQARVDFDRLADIVTDDCVLWPHAVNSAGYGKLFVDGRLQLVSRLALERHVGPPPTPDAYAIHGPCHNPLCMNARGEHVRWGTAKENQADRHRDGTANGPRRVA